MEISIRRVINGADLQLVINELLPQSFDDPTDIDPPEVLERYHEEGLGVYHMVLVDDLPIGFTLTRVNPLTSAGYCPYMGINPEWRNRGVGTAAFALIAQDLPVTHILFDFEDPDRMENVYPEKPLEDVVSMCLRRIGFWRRNGCFVVNDREVPYCRPASDDTSEVQAYDCLAVRPVDLSDSRWGGVFNADHSAMSAEAYRRFYLEIFQLEFGSREQLPSEEELRAEYPAIELFLARLDASGREWVSLYSDRP